MKKLIFVCLSTIVMFSLVGCAKVIDLTDEENYLIAEYAADLLVKYDRNMDDKYHEAYLDDLKNNSITEVAEETTTELVTEVTEETSDTTEEVVQTTTEEDKTTTEDTTVADNTTEATHGTVTEEDVKGDTTVNVAEDFDIAEFAGVDIASIKYSYYILSDRYPSLDKEGMYIEITAPDGYKLLVVKFDIENKTNEQQYIDMYSTDVNYNIIINDKKSAKQMLTILMDDLYTYQNNIGPSMRQEAVLLFQVSDSVAEKIQDLKLKVIKGDTTKIMQLQ